MSGNVSKAEDVSVRWPCDGDRLFVSASWAYEAEIIRDPKERFYRMPMGYKRAADILVERAMVDVVDRKNVIYGALFCYRQSIELFLKRLIDEFGEDTHGHHDPKRKKGRKSHHNLSDLWERFMEIVKVRGREGMVGLEAAQVLIREMHAADEKSDGFRFPTDIAGLPFAFGDQGIDLCNLREVMMGLQNLFESAYMDFSHQDDVVSERYTALR
jgi:hypothetical protein